MTIAEQIRVAITSLADIQKTAGWDTQIEIAKAATVLAREANRLDLGRSEVVAGDVKFAGAAE